MPNVFFRTCGKSRNLNEGTRITAASRVAQMMTVAPGTGTCHSLDLFYSIGALGSATT